MIQEANLHWRFIDTESNLIMPWYTLPTLQWLKKQDTKQWQVFEYGAGYSTIWWRLNCLTVHSVEDNKQWASVMFAEYFTDDAFVKNISIHFDNNDLCDCVIVDGSQREECVEFSQKYLKSGGYLIFDNYGQQGSPEFPPAEKIDELLAGWEKQVFRQPNHTNWATAVFKKP
jgi:predicted O-methyltransferase YrrM